MAYVNFTVRATVMSETAILEQLEKLTDEIRSMKAEIQELKGESKADAVELPDVEKEVVLNVGSELDIVQLREVCDELLIGLNVRL